MAFGSTAQKEARESTGTGEAADFTYQWVPVNNGIRKVRFLPALDSQGELITVPQVDRAGKATGKHVYVTADEVEFTEIWWKFMNDGNERNLRIFVSAENPWNNPFWKRVAEKTEKGSPERKAMKRKFAVNVVDKTTVLFDEDGKPVYPDESGKYCIIATLGLKRCAELTGTAKPLNQIRILEGSTGQVKPPGKHFFQQLYDMIGVHEDGDGNIRDLWEFDINIKATGTGTDRRYAATPTAVFSKTPDELIYAPRYDLAEWAKPWPNDAIHDLLDGADIDATIEKYGIVQYPRLKPVKPESDGEAPFDNAVPKSNGKKGKKQQEDDADDLFA